MLFLKQSVEERREMIINGSILNTLLFLSIPTLLVGIIQALIPLSDNFFLTNLTNVVVAGSVTFSQPVLNIMVALSQGLGVAAMAMIGKYYGKGIMRAVRETIYNRTYTDSYMYSYGFCYFKNHFRRNKRYSIYLHCSLLIRNASYIPCGYLQFFQECNRTA